MKILISKLPKSGWWNSGIPNYKDNPAMKKGVVPDFNTLNMEREHLIKVLRLEKYEVLEIEFPKELDSTNPKHDFIFVRDQFISDINNTVVILRAGEKLRRIENIVMKKILKKYNYNIIEMPNLKGMKADGGEFYFCNKESILFSGVQRNSKLGIDFVSKSIKAKELIILNGKGFHLDTFFAPVLNESNILCAVIACCSVLTNQSQKLLKSFCYDRKIPLFDIPEDDAIGTKKKVGSFAVNSLSLPGLLIGPSKFSNPEIDLKLKDLGVKRIISPASQYQLSGGSIHCITNQL